MRRVSVVALGFLLLIAASCVTVGISPGVAIAQDKTPADIFITPVFWFPMRSDFSFQNTKTDVARETPQGGLQLGFRYGNFSVGLSGLWMSETDRLNRNTGPDDGFQSTVNFDRYDLDFSAAYTIRDVIKDRLSLSPGFSLFTAHVDENETCNVNCDSEQSRISRHRFFWALGPSLGASIRLADRWYLGVNSAVAWGKEHTTQPKTDGGDETQDAFFSRSDVNIRYLLSDTVSLFTGYKVQLVSAHGAHDFLWHGPTIGLTVRFNLQ